ncbi:hypothetical protein [Sulfuricurvum sp.]|uniref:hypothetical protein n=1 Tax=Sulfuricurvum sp. TaxID=2025608 RepID=UPI00286E33AD|nr:hypothetical protein [Sulfuricurvum sp.]
MKTLFRLILFGLGCYGYAFEFSGPFPTKDYPYTIHKSGEEVCTDCPSVVSWLDNDRVIFTRLKKGEPFLQASSFKPFVFSGETVIWDTKKDKIIPYHDGMLWCSYNGYSSIYYNDGAQSQESAYGFNGFEHKEKVKRFWQKGDPITTHSDMHMCLKYNSPPFKPNTPNWTYPLREQDGVVDLGWKKDQNDPRPSTPVGVIRPDGKRIDLPLKAGDVSGVWWDEWAETYIIKMLLSGANKVGKLPSRPDALIFLHPNGTVENYPLPYAYWWSKYTSRAAISKKGVVVVNEQANALPPGKMYSGAYLVRGEQVVRLNDWYVGNERSGLDNIHRGLAVSPDGCKIAYKHTDGPRVKNESTIQMINLCEGDE